MEGTKVETKGMSILKDKLKEYKGEDAVISISHKLYGNQKLKCKFDYIFDKQRIGFYINKQEIYIDRDKIVDYGTKDGIYFADDIMEIRIKMQ